MRALTIGLVSAALLAMPAVAQQQNDSNGLGNVLRNLNQAINPGGNRQDGRNRQDERNRQNYGSSYQNNGGNNGFSGGSTYEPEYRNGRMVLRDQSDVNAEQQRLNELQGQINQAQQQLNREQRDFDAARRGG